MQASSCSAAAGCALRAAPAASTAPTGDRGQQGKPDQYGNLHAAFMLSPAQHRSARQAALASLRRFSLRYR
ncbi:MAG: hypothetical protein F4X39_10395 [Acidobacteriia bacterium]|nr:hypothetical protein [Terriglobia bacterium]